METQFRQLTEWRGRFYLQPIHKERQRPNVPGNEAVSENTCSIDSGGNIVTWHTAAESLFGCLPSDALGQSFYHFCDPAEAYDGRFERVLSTAYRRGRAKSEHRFISKNGSCFRGSIMVKPIWDRGEFRGYTVSIEPIF
jgi:PAS domain S-box-containing protein